MEPRQEAPIGPDLEAEGSKLGGHEGGRAPAQLAGPASEADHESPLRAVEGSRRVVRDEQESARLLAQVGQAGSDFAGIAQVLEVAEAHHEVEGAGRAGQRAQVALDAEDALRAGRAGQAAGVEVEGDQAGRDLRQEGAQAPVAGGRVEDALEV